MLGVGDSMAAIVGSKYGRLRVPFTNKTFEGCMAFVASSLIVLLGWSYFNCESILVSKYVGVVIATAVVELFTTQIDNLLLPQFAVQLSMWDDCLFIKISFIALQNMIPESFSGNMIVILKIHHQRMSSHITILVSSSH